MRFVGGVFEPKWRKKNYCRLMTQRGLMEDAVGCVAYCDFPFQSVTNTFPALPLFFRSFKYVSRTVIVC